MPPGRFCVRAIQMARSDRELEEQNGRRMFLTTLEHEGEVWTVDLRVVSHENRPASLEFSFVSGPTREGSSRRLTWRISGDTLGALSRDGVDVSEDLLRRQLSRALREGEAHGAAGIPRGPWVEDERTEQATG